MDRALKIPIVCSVQGSTTSLLEAVEFSQTPGEFKGRRVIPVPSSKMNAAALRTNGRSNSPERISKFRGCKAVMVAAEGEIAMTSMTSKSFVPPVAAVIAKLAPSEWPMRTIFGKKRGGEEVGSEIDFSPMDCKVS
jgi:hypothetical protein